MNDRDTKMVLLVGFLTIIVILAWWLFLQGCAPVRPATDTAADCPRACQTLAWYSCPGWRGSPGADEQWGTVDDESCETVCREVYAEPSGTLHAACTAAAMNCAEVEACFAGGE